MEKTNISVSGYFSDDSKGFDMLFGLRRNLERAQGAVEFSFQDCRFVSPPALAYIAALVQHARLKGLQISIQRDVSNEKVREHLVTNRLFQALLEGKQDISKPTSVVPFGGHPQLT